MNGDWKEFHLVAEPVVRELSPGMNAHLWGYNGQSPGPTIEAVEGDKVRLDRASADRRAAGDGPAQGQQGDETDRVRMLHGCPLLAGPATVDERPPSRAGYSSFRMRS
jgi:hypothetical protein